MRIERTHDTSQDLDQAVEALEAADRAKKDADARLKEAQAQVLRLLAAKQEKTWEIRDGGKYYRATAVYREDTKVDEAGLAKKIGIRRFRKICDLKVNRALLERALDTGEVTLAEASAFLSTKPVTPYIRFTEGTIEEKD